MNNFSDLIKLSKYYLAKKSQDLGTTKIVDTTSTENIEINAQDFLSYNSDPIKATFLLVHVKKLIKGSELAFNLQEQYRKSFKEFTPEHSKCIDLLAKINENLKILHKEQDLLMSIISKNLDLYHKHLKLHDIEI